MAPQCLVWATEPVTYDVYPYGLTYHRGSLYLVGFAPDHREIRHWKVDRMENAELTPVHFSVARCGITRLCSNVARNATTGPVPIPLRPQHGLDAEVCRSKHASDREDLTLRQTPAALEPHLMPITLRSAGQKYLRSRNSAPGTQAE